MYYLHVHTVRRGGCGFDLFVRTLIFLNPLFTFLFTIMVLISLKSSSSPDKSLVGSRDIHFILLSFYFFIFYGQKSPTRHSSNIFFFRSILKIQVPLAVLLLKSANHQGLPVRIKIRQKRLPILPVLPMSQMPVDVGKNRTGKIYRLVQTY